MTGLMCTCGHSAHWHHPTARGCGYHGYTASKRCRCSLSADGAVEAIVARHVEAFRAEAVAAIEMQSGCTCETCETYNHAARIVRDLPTPTPPRPPSPA